MKQVTRLHPENDPKHKTKESLKSKAARTKTLFKIPIYWKSQRIEYIRHSNHTEYLVSENSLRSS